MPADLPTEEKTATDRGADISVYARKWADMLDTSCKKYLRELLVGMCFQSREDETKSEFGAFGFELDPAGGFQASLYAAGDKDGVDEKSEQLLTTYAEKLEKKRKLLGMEGQLLLMALTEEDDIWKYGTLKC